jgi:sulfur dioxygenase
MGMRQLFDPESCTYTYLLWDKDTEDAILVDPVANQVKRDLTVATTLNLCYAVNTHLHEDHISGTGSLKRKLPGLKSVISGASGARADELIGDGDEIHFGHRFVTAVATPGHTPGCLSFLTDDGGAVLTGDALHVQGCGRTDLPGGSAAALYDSVHRLFRTLPDGTVVFPGHESYQADLHSTIGKEKDINPRFYDTKEAFVEMMKNLKQPPPKGMEVCVAANLEDGAKPFFVRALRARIKERWGVFG